MYIITGAAGFIGSAIVTKLNQIGKTELLLVDEIGKSASWKNLVDKSYLEYIHKTELITQIRSGGLSNYKTGSIKAIIHMGASSSTTEEDMDYLMNNNFRYSRDLAQFARKHKIRFINASSAATYGAGEFGYDDQQADIERYRPLNRYGYSKQLFDVWAKQHNFLDQLVSLKFFNVYGFSEAHKGSQASMIYHAFNQIQTTSAVALFKSYRPDYQDGEQKRDFVYVKDCVDIIVWLLENKQVKGLFNVGTGQARSWNDLAKSVFAALGREPKINYIAMPENLQNQYQYFTEAPMEKLKKAGYPHKFHSLEDGTADYVKNYLLTNI